MKMVALGEVALVNPRGETVAGDSSVSFVGMAELDAEQAVARPHATRRFAEVSKGYTVFRNRDVLAAKITPCWENGKVGQAALDHAVGVGSTEFHVLRPGSDLDDRYLLHFLRQPWVRRTGESRMTGSAGQKRVPASFIRDLEIPLPPMPEQRRVAAILDHADGLRAKRRQVLAHLDALTRSIYFEMFEGHQWPSTPLVELAASPDDIKCGPFGTQLNVSEFRSSGVPLLGIKNVNAKFDLPPFEFLDESTASRLSAYDLRPGDLVMTRKGTIGNCAIYPSTLSVGVMHSDLLRARISPQAADVVFLEHHLQLSPHISHQIRMMSPGAVMPGINVTKLKQLAIDTPPIVIQREFATRVGAIDRQRAAVRRVVSANDELLASLQARAFDGRL